MGLELYLDLLSQPCRALYIFARSNNIPFEFKRVQLMKGQHKTEEFRKVNVLMKVPALRDGSFTLAESVDGVTVPAGHVCLAGRMYQIIAAHKQLVEPAQTLSCAVPCWQFRVLHFYLTRISIAILLYLAQKFKTPDHWYPSDLQKRARVDEYLSWQHANIRAKGSKVFLSKVLLPILTGQPLSAEKLEFLIEDLNVVLKQFEEKFLQDKPFIAGSEISLADLVALVELMQPVGAGYNLFEERPKLAEWRRRVEEAVGKELFQEAHEGIMNIKNLTADQFAPELLESFKQQLLKQVSQN